MTPTQLRAFATVARLGSVKAAAAELEVTEAAVSLHVGQLRKELGDQLFTRTASGLAFTPGGLRLASRAVELLGLQDRTVLEVRQAAGGRRLLRVGASSMFAEYAAPGLIGVFAERARDLDVELSVHRSAEFESLLLSRSLDATIGPRAARDHPGIAVTHFLNYQVVAVVSPKHPLAVGEPAAAALRDQTWLLGPSATEESGAVPAIIRRLGVPEQKERIFQSHAAALEEAKRGSGVALALSFSVSRDVATGTLVQLPGPLLQVGGTWNIWTLSEHHAPPEALELARFVTTPRATQAMLRGPGTSVGRFKPSVHVTLWS
ncbi:MAG: LysR family transcriptional regulator [Nocardioides sp.]